MSNGTHTLTATLTDADGLTTTNSVDVNVQNVWLAQLLRDNYVGILNRSGGNIAILLSNIGAPPPVNSN